MKPRQVVIIFAHLTDCLRPFFGGDMIWTFTVAFVFNSNSTPLPPKKKSYDAFSSISPYGTKHHPGIHPPTKTRSVNDGHQVTTTFFVSQKLPPKNLTRNKKTPSVLSSTINHQHLPPSFCPTTHQLLWGPICPSTTSSLRSCWRHVLQSKAPKSSQVKPSSMWSSRTGVPEGLEGEEIPPKPGGRYGWRCILVWGVIPLVTPK